MFKKVCYLSLLMGFHIIILFWGCSQSDTNGSRQYKKIPDEQGFPVEISISDCFSDPIEGLVLSDIADSIEYLVLETTEDYLQKRIIGVIKYNNGFLINDNHETLSFVDLYGCFHWKINQRGRGPNEYESLSTNIAIDRLSNEIIIPTNNKLLFFNNNGEYIRQIRLPYMIDQVYASKNGAYILANSNPYNRILAHVINREGIPITDYYQNNLAEKLNDVGARSFFTNSSIESIGDEILINNGDTVWQLENDFRLQAKYIFNSQIRDAKDRTFMFTFNQILENMISFSFMYQKFNIVYNLQSEQFFKIPGRGPSSAIVDDIDYGTDVQVWREENGLIIDALSPIELLSLNENLIRENSKLRHIITRLGENDNPVLRIIYLKQ